jgi:hypothetical protein
VGAWECSVRATGQKHGRHALSCCKMNIYRGINIFCTALGVGGGRGSASALALHTDHLYTCHFTQSGTIIYDHLFFPLQLSRDLPEPADLLIGTGPF